MDNIRQTGAEMVITANTGCLMQIDCESRMSGAGIRVLHPMEVLYLSYLGEQPAKYIRSLAKDIKSLSL